MNYEPNEKSLANLKTFKDMTEEERFKAQSNGGKKSGKVRREKRAFKQLLEIAMSQLVHNKAGESKSRKELAMMRLAERCTNGDLRAIELAERILGEVQAQKMEVTGKDGRELIPARRLSAEEAAELMKEMDKEY